MDKSARYQASLAAVTDFLSHYSPPVSSVAAMATICSSLKEHFPELIFVGFYVTREIEGRLVQEVGPYQGAIAACCRIEFGCGVVGTVSLRGEALVIPDVEQCDNYIACDKFTKSEVVVPVLKDGLVVATLDIDGPEVNYFDEQDVDHLQAFTALLTAYF
jgi:GAF domain-containing protein